ncbi:ribonuclease H-like domain-containing protein [Mycena polygramma]|nr:ribonuclease H-like domain-containing protein [Mycena polygramma]
MATLGRPQIWSRPAPQVLKASSDLVFFQTECLRDADQIMIFGVTKGGNSVCVHVKDCGHREIRQEVPSMSWVKIGATKFVRISDLAKRSLCQFEFDASWTDIKLQPVERAAPLRILSFDIECLGREGIFPQPALDPVIQISNVVSILGDTGPPFIRNVFTLDTCSEISGANVIPHEDEASLLQSWSDFVRQVDPDLVIGYNTTGFDFSYLLARAKALQIPLFPFLGRLKDAETARARTISYTTVRGHTRTWEDIPLPGRLQLDLMHYIRREEPSAFALSLNAVSKLFLRERKEEVHFTAISGLQTGSADTRRLLAVYCLKDAYLPLRLLEVLGCVNKYTRRAQEKGIEFNSILPDYEDTRTDTQTPADVQAPREIAK